jgi:hypothetical protein
VPLYLYSYLNLFGYMGRGTPEDPGTDFGMSVSIDAPDERAALDWGKLVLADYIRARFRFDSPDEDIDSGQVEGWIVRDKSALDRAKGRYPQCQVGEIPSWHDPWQLENA